MSHDDSAHCFFARQPVTSEEVNAAIRATWTSCCQSLRYGGDNPAILARFIELGEPQLCDIQLDGDAQVIRRNAARFVYSPTSEDSLQEKQRIRTLIESLSKAFSNSYCDCREFKFRSDCASFKYFWGAAKKKARTNSIKVRVCRETSDGWMLNLDENIVAERGTAIQIDEILRKHPNIRSIRWFDSDDPLHTERPRPY